MKLRAPIEYFANLVFYHLCRFEKVVGLAFSGPIIALLKLPAVDRMFRKRGIEYTDEGFDRALYNKRNGVGAMMAGRHLTLLFCLILFGTINFLSAISWIDLTPFGKGNLAIFLFILLTFIPAEIASEVLVEHKKKYLKYFKQFEKKSEQWHFRTAVLTFFTVVGIWGYAIGGFAFYLSRLP